MQFIFIPLLKIKLTLGSFCWNPLLEFENLKTIWKTLTIEKEQKYAIHCDCMTIKIIIHRAVFLRCFILLEGKNSITVTMQAVWIITRHRYRLVMTFVNDKTFAEIGIFLWAVILQFSKVWGHFGFFLLWV